MSALHHAALHAFGLAPPLALLALAALPQDPAAERAGAEFFEAEVRPVLAAHCTECHGGARPKGGLDLSTPAALAAAIRDLGFVTAAEAGAEPGGLMLESISYEDPLLAMPPKGKLPDDALATLREWARRGAPLPAADAPAPAPTTADGGFDLAARRASHWAWQPPADPAPPEVRAVERVRDPLDRFVLAELEAAGLPVAPEAPRAVWLRRVTFLLHGLPPTVEEQTTFEADTAAGAHERVVDRLLASPRYGERMARHWLDLVRYAETKGHEFDFPLPNAWQYRDYVVRAFDADVPYDRFLAEHLAGDLMADDPGYGPRLDPTGRFDESVLGTGWWWMHEDVHSPVDTRADEADKLANQVDTLTKAALGLTVACARCHDHKFDPVPTEDYYALCGFALSMAYRQVPFEARTANAAVAREHTALAQAQDAARRGAIAAFVREVADTLTVAGVAPATRPLSSPLAWVRLAADTPAELAGTLARELAQGDAPPPPAPVIEYGAPGTAWIQDGEAFGRGPRSTGEVFLGVAPDPSRVFASTPEGEAAARAAAAAARPRIATREAAAVDPFWRGLEPAPGAGRHGGEASHVQSGRTLVTKTVPIEGGHVFHLVRGRGTVFAVCNSHRMLTGPLWGRTLQHFDTGGEWRHLHQDLTDLVGAHARFEYTPADDAGDYGLEVAAVFDLAEHEPPAPAADGAWMAQRLAEAGATDDAGVLEVAREALRDAATFVEQGGVPGRLLLDRERLGLALAVEELLAEAAAQAALPGGGASGGASEGASEGGGESASSAEAEVAAAADATPDAAPTAGPAATHGAALDAAWSRLAEALAAPREAEAALAARVVRVSALAPASLELEGRDEVVLRRGDPRSPGAPAPRRDLAAVRGDDAALAAPGGGSGRLALARVYTGGEHPLVARVWVNRLWHHTFGRGLVETVDDLGATGAKPSHPALLDRLARDLASDGWSTKRMLRRFVLSDTFRRASTPPAGVAERDPRNVLLSHMPVRRLEAEALRDSLLFVAGELDEARFGPPVPVHLTDFMQGRGRPGSSGPLDGGRRRTLYQEVRRNFVPPLLAVWDFPVPSATRGARSVSNVPAQALALANDPFVVDRAKAFAGRALGQTRDVDARVELMLRAAFGRAPVEGELAACREFLAAAGRGAAGYTDLAQALFSMQEFVWIP